MADAYTPYTNLIITPSIVSGWYLKVEIKNYDGTDFSALKPLVHKIGTTPRTLTAALSVTIDYTSNLCNAGSAELFGRDIDLFVYLGWRASNSTMFVLVSRIPYARTYADFSTTATNEKYGAYSGSAPASTDPVENIGRIRAQKGGAASPWSIPNNVVVNRPIYESDWLTWLPAYAVSTGSYTSVRSLSIKYRVHQGGVDIALCFDGTVSGATTYIQTSLPFAHAIALSLVPAGVISGGGTLCGVAQFESATTTTAIRFFPNTGTFTAGATFVGGTLYTTYPIT